MGEKKSNKWKQWIKNVVMAVMGYRFWNFIVRKLCLRGDMKKQLKKNKRFKNIHLGKRCFIIGNGPSVKNLDFKLFADEIVFTVNQLSRVPNFSDLKTNYHLWVDDIFFKPTDNDHMIEVMKKVKTDTSNPEVFYTYTAKPMIDNYQLQDFLNINYFKQRTLMYDNLKEKMDFTEIVPHCGTVIQYAIMLAYYMGIKEIYLLGCECTSILKTIEKVSETSMGDYYAYETNEKDKQNYSVNIISEFSGHAQLLTDYGRLYEYMAKRGVSLVNCTGGGLLKNIPCENINTILQGSKND